MLFVTALFDLESREPHTKRRSVDVYLELGVKLLSLNIDIAIYCDSQVADRIAQIPRPHGAKTHIIKLDLEQLPYYTDKSKIASIRKSGGFPGANPNKDTIFYTIAQHSKLLLMSKSKSMTDAQHLVWVDFGIAHVSPDVSGLETLEPSDKFKILCLRPTYYSEISQPSFFKHFQGRTGGGVLSVPTSKIDMYLERFESVRRDLMLNGLCPLEEEILTKMRVENPELFDLYYGDYSDIITNFNGGLYVKTATLELLIRSAMIHQDINTICDIGRAMIISMQWLQQHIPKSTLDLVLNLVRSSFHSKGDFVSLNAINKLCM